MKKIIIVDEARLVRELLDKIIKALEVPDIETESFRNGQIAWQSIQKGPRDLDAIIITDVGAPALHGFNLLTSVKVRCPNVRVIVTSFNERHAGGAERLQADAFVHKGLFASFVPTMQRTIREFL